MAQKYNPQQPTCSFNEGPKTRVKSVLPMLTALMLTYLAP